MIAASIVSAWIALAAFPMMGIALAYLLGPAGELRADALSPLPPIAIVLKGVSLGAHLSAIGLVFYIVLVPTLPFLIHGTANSIKDGQLSRIVLLGAGVGAGLCISTFAMFGWLLLASMLTAGYTGTLLSAGIIAFLAGAGAISGAMAGLLFWLIRRPDRDQPSPASNDTSA